MASEGDSKKLSDLRVVDLRSELEKRGLDKGGNKANLLERLQKALESENINPDEYYFDMSGKKTEKRLSTSTKDDNDSNTDSIANDTTMETSTDNVTNPNDQSESVDLDDSKIESVGAESPLNLSIGEEEECLLLNSGEEMTNILDKSSSSKTDEKSAPSSQEKEKPKDTEHSSKEPVVKEVDLQATQPDSSGKKNPSSRGEGSSKEKASDTSNSSNPCAVSSSDAMHAKSDNKLPKNHTGRSLWVTNLLPSTRAQELKHVLSRYGKVIGAKVVQSSRYPRTRCYGYVTMETRSDADLCMKKLNNTELKGQIIRITKVRPEHSLPLKTPSSTTSTKTADKGKRITTTKDKNESTEKKKSDTHPDKKKEDKSTKSDAKKVTKPEEKGAQPPSRKDRSISASKKSVTSQKDKRTDILTFDKIREERERQRRRERERALREEEKRRRDIQRAREIEKRHREEALRLERECEKLRMERDRLDRQRVEIIRLERERQKAEREKLEREKQELRREQLRLEEARRAPKRPSSTESNHRYDTTYAEDRKRIATERHFEGTPPPPRFDVSAREAVPEKKEISKDYKSRIQYSKREEFNKRPDFKPDFRTTERHSSGHTTHIIHGVNNGSGSSKYESPTYVPRERERDLTRESNRRETIVPNVSPPRISKEARYGDRERSPVAYRVRDERERHQVTDHRNKTEIRTQRDHRYGETMKDSSRYREGGSWHSSSSGVKPFGGGISSSANPVRESWTKSDNWRPMDSSSNERWVGNSSSRMMMTGSSSIPNPMYSGGNSGMSGLTSGMSACPSPPGSSNYPLERFENYKLMNNPRKY